MSEELSYQHRLLRAIVFHFRNPYKSRLPESAVSIQGCNGKAAGRGGRRQRDMAGQAEGDLNFTVVKDWKSKHVRLKSGKHLAVHIPYGDFDQPFKAENFDFDSLDAGDSIFIAGAIDASSVKKLMTGKIERDGHGAINAPKLAVTTTDPLIILGENINIIFSC